MKTPAILFTLLLATVLGASAFTCDLENVGNCFARTVQYNGTSVDYCSFSTTGSNFCVAFGQGTQGVSVCLAAPNPGAPVVYHPPVDAPGVCPMCGSNCGSINKCPQATDGCTSCVQRIIPRVGIRTRCEAV